MGFKHIDIYLLLFLIFNVLKTSYLEMHVE